MNITGNSQYSVFIGNGANAELTGVSAGTYEVGPINGGFGPGNNNDINIVDDLIANCEQTIDVGDFECQPSFSCGLTASINPECIPGTNSFNLVIELNGSGTYQIQNDNYGPGGGGPGPA